MYKSCVRPILKFGDIMFSNMTLLIVDVKKRQIELL